MINYIAKISALIVLLIACTQNEVLDKNIKPAVDELKMIEVLTDLNMFESWRTYMQINYPTDSLNSAAIKGYYLKIMKAHNLKYEDFRASLTYFQTQNPDKYNEILDSVNVRIGEVLVRK